MLRVEAIELLNEIVGKRPHILAFAFHINILCGGGTSDVCKLIIKASLNSESRSELLEIVQEKGFSLSECPNDIWIIS